MMIRHPNPCFTEQSSGQQGERSQQLEHGVLLLRFCVCSLHPLATAMALLSPFSGPVSLRNVSCNQSGVVAIGRVQHGAACLASSASSQMLGTHTFAWQCTRASRKLARRAHALGIRCERATEGGNRRSVDTWIGRAAMLGFVAAIGVEISTGKGVLESAGLPTPVSPLVLGLIALAGSVTAFGVFRSTETD